MNSVKTSIASGKRAARGAVGRLMAFGVGASMLFSAAATAVQFARAEEGALKIGDAVNVRRGHPRVLITQADLPELVKRCAPDGAMHARYKIVLDRCQLLVEDKAELCPKPGDIWGPARDWCYLALAALVENASGRDGRKYATVFTSKVWDQFIEDGKKWAEKNAKPVPPGGHLHAGHYGYHALIFDWLYPVLTPEERTKYAELVSDTMNKGNKGPLTANVGWWYNQEWGPLHLSDTHNRTAIVCKTLAALAIVGEGTGNDDKAKEYIESFAKHIPGSCIPAFNQMGGAWSEGLGHFGYMNAVQFYIFEAWRTATGENLWTQFEPDGYAREISRWHLYSTQPFNQRLAYVDDSHGSFPSLLALPLLAKTYKDGVAQRLFNAFDEQGRIEAGGGFGFWEAWQGLLWSDPTVPEIDLATLPTAHHFKGAGHVYMRSGWSGPNETFAFFGAGPRYANWAADDEGHFLIAKQGPLVTRGSGKSNHHGYTRGTALFNCVLVYDPNESFGKHEGGNENDGGLRRESQARNAVERGHLVAYRHEPSAFTYAAADLTDGYANSKNSDEVFKLTKSRKIRSLTRQFLYLRGEQEHFLVFDRVDATNKEFPKTWMLHMGGEPALLSSGAEAKATETGDGYATFAATADTATFLSCPENEKNVSSTGKAKIFCRTLLPKSARITRRGGKGFDTWGNPHNPKACRQHLAAETKDETPPFYRWRLEVEPPEQNESDVFLHVLSLTGEAETTPPQVELIEQEGKCGAAIVVGGQRIEVLFNKTGEVGAEVRSSAPGKEPVRWPLANEIQPQAQVK